MYLYPNKNYAASSPPSYFKAESIELSAWDEASAWIIIASAAPSAFKIAAFFSASETLTLAILSPSEVRMLALFLLSASA